MNARIALALALTIAYVTYRAAPHVPRSPLAPAVAPFADIGKLAQQLNAEDKAALRDTYTVLARAVEADPAADPVFIDTDAVRRAHRAALLVVWKGVLGNKTGEVPGLKDALEGAVAARIGSDDIPMNPQLKADTAKAFTDVATSIK
jgi:hypothetical protein